LALSGETCLVGSYRDDIGLNDNQGSAYFYERMSRIYLPLVVKNSS